MCFHFSLSLVPLIRLPPVHSSLPARLCLPWISWRGCPECTCMQLWLQIQITMLYIMPNLMVHRPFLGSARHFNIYVCTCTCSLTNLVIRGWLIASGPVATFRYHNYYHVVLLKILCISFSLRRRSGWWGHGGGHWWPWWPLEEGERDGEEEKGVSTGWRRGMLSMMYLQRIIKVTSV
jgi:hypothetical protein